MNARGPRDADTPLADYVPFSSHVSEHVLKTRSGEYLITWAVEGLPFVGRDPADIDHRHLTFNRLLQSLRAPDFANVAFWIHDVRRRRGIERPDVEEGGFHAALASRYFAKLGKERVLQNTLYLTLLYRPTTAGRSFREKPANLTAIQRAERVAIDTTLELAGSVEAVLSAYGLRRLGLWTAKNGVVFSSALSFFGFLLNRVDEPVPVLSAPVNAYLPVSRIGFSPKSGDFIVSPPAGRPGFGALLTIKEYPSATSPGILNGLKYLDFEYVITHSFPPRGGTRP